MRVAGSDPRILELYSQKSKFTRRQRNSKSSSRIIEPLTASQFIKNSTLQSKRRKRKRSKYLPASKGSIAPRFMPQLKEAVKRHEGGTESLADTDLTDNLTLRLANIAENKEPINVIKYEADVNNSFLPLATPNAELSDPDRNISGRAERDAKPSDYKNAGVNLNTRQ